MNPYCFQKRFLSYGIFFSALLFTCGCSLPWSQEREGDSSEDSVTADAELSYAEVVVDGTVVRDGGQGTCGEQPWAQDCTTYRLWWGQTLRAAFHAELVVIPDGENRWVITNNEDVLKNYSNLPLSLETYNDIRSGSYLLAIPTIDFGSTMGCSGAIKMSAKNFNTQVMGVARDGYVKLVMFPQAVETITGTCGTIVLNQETTTWRWAVSAALAGDPEDMTVILGYEEFIPAGTEQPFSSYEKYIKKDVNPSPQNRDHAEVTLLLNCKDKDGVYTDCPWASMVRNTE